MQSEINAVFACYLAPLVTIMTEDTEEKAYEILRSVFKHETYRSDTQQAAVEAVMKRECF